MPVAPPRAQDMARSAYSACAVHHGARAPCRALYVSAALALVIEAALLVGVGWGMMRPHTTARLFRPPRPVTIMLSPPVAVPQTRRDRLDKPESSPGTGTAAPVRQEAPKPALRSAARPDRAPVQPARAAYAARMSRAARAAHGAHAAPPKPQPVVPSSMSQPDPNPVMPPSLATPTPDAAAARSAPMPNAAQAVSPPRATSAYPGAGFKAALRGAIEAALRYPESAQEEQRSGRTLVGFIYRDGAASDIHVVSSSGMPALDRAALAAVRDAQCPPAPHGFAGKNLSEQIWVNFAFND